MIYLISATWYWFNLCLAVMLITTLVMSRQSRYFFTMGTTRKSFSMFDLEFPVSARSLYSLVAGIDSLDAAEQVKVKKALRGQLMVDFLFMPAIYLAILLLCLKAAAFFPGNGAVIFEVMAVLQLLSWLLDITENIFLLIFLGKPVVLSTGAFKAYQLLEAVKWGGATVGLFCSTFSLLYFWLSGNFRTVSLPYLLVAIGLLVAFFLAAKLLKKYKP